MPDIPGASQNADGRIPLPCTEVAGVAQSVCRLHYGPEVAELGLDSRQGQEFLFSWQRARPTVGHIQLLGHTGGGLFLRESRDRGVKSISHFLLRRRLRLSGVKLLLPHIPPWCGVLMNRDTCSIVPCTRQSLHCTKKKEHDDFIFTRRRTKTASRAYSRHSKLIRATLQQHCRQCPPATDRNTHDRLWQIHTRSDN